MAYSGLLLSLGGQLQTFWGKRRGAPGATRGWVRPRLEILEDRTVLSPMLVADINQQSVDSNVHNLVNLDGELYFAADDGTHGNQLWKSDGTADGTVMVTDINPGPGAGFDPGNLTPVGHTLFFSANDSSHGYELWKSDGTSDGTTLVKDLNAGAGSPTRPCLPTSTAHSFSKPTTARHSTFTRATARRTAPSKSRGITPPTGSAT